MLKKIVTWFDRDKDRTNSKPGKIGFNNLPKEIKLLVLSFLNPVELYKIASVSKEFNQLSSENILWKQFLKPEQQKNLKNTSLSAKFTFRLYKILEEEETKKKISQKLDVKGLKELMEPNYANIIDQNAINALLQLDYKYEEKGGNLNDIKSKLESYTKNYKSLHFESLTNNLDFKLYCKDLFKNHKPHKPDSDEDHGKNNDRPVTIK